MNNLIINFDQIVNKAKNYGVSPTKRRGILREYLQLQFIDRLYAHRQANQLSFVGGTSLRLLRGLPRFSEDLDFDNLGLSDRQIEQLVSSVARIWGAEGVDLELEVKNKRQRSYFQIKFPRLLKELKISTDPREKLMIKFDYSQKWRGQMTEVVLLNRFGVIQQVITNSLNQLLVQKLAAYIDRRQTQVRDIFDIVWLVAQGARLDEQFLVENKLTHLLANAKTKWQAEGVSAQHKKKLAPFLFESQQLNKVDLLGEVLNQL